MRIVCAPGERLGGVREISGRSTVTRRSGPPSTVTQSCGATVIVATSNSPVNSRPVKFSRTSEAELTVAASLPL
jgi:hypothetical protein